MAFKAASLWIFIHVGSSSDITGSAGLRELTYYAAEKKETVKLYGNLQEYAYWFVDLLVGTPPQRTSVIVDTGSGVCAFTCNVCKDCGNHIDKAFDFGASSSAAWSSCSADCPSGSCVDNHCAYRVSYSEGSSLSGYWFTDNVQLGDTGEENIPAKSFLGCHTSETNLFFTQSVNGILGLAPRSSRSHPSILESLFVDERIDKSIFSLCIAHEGGELTVGGPPDSVELAYIPMKTNTFYTVTLSSMSMGSSTMGTVFSPAVVDSGTTLSYFPTEVYNRLIAAIESFAPSASQRKNSRCWRPTETQPLPPITFTFGSVSVEWSADAYLYASKSGLKCLAFADSGRATDTILGASFMINKHVVFDLSQERIGIASSQCPINKNRPDHVLGEESVVEEERIPEHSIPPKDEVDKILPTTPPPEIQTTTAPQVMNQDSKNTDNQSSETAKSPSDNTWIVWFLVALITICINVLVYRLWTRRTVLDPEREQLRPGDTPPG